MQDIADRVGVSKITVSRALRNTKGLSKETAERIKKAAEELGYRPNPLLSVHMQNLRALRPPMSSANLVFLTPGSSTETLYKTPILSGIWEGAHARSVALGYSLERIFLADPDMSPKRMMKIMRARNICGVLIPSLPLGIKRIELEWESFAAASIGLMLESPLLHRVASNQFHDFKIVFRELAALGYRRIGVLLNLQKDKYLEYIWTGGLAAAQAQLKPAARIPPLKGYTLTRTQVE